MISTERCFAFLRAINVGGHTVRMDRLRALFESLGLNGVSTFIASGNVIFESPAGEPAALEARIERHLSLELGWDVATFLRSAKELEAIVRPDAFPGADAAAAGASRFVVFLRGPPGAKARRRILELRSDTDDLHVAGREIHWLRRGSFRESRLSGPLLEQRVGSAVTVRNLNTVTRVFAKFADPS